MITMNDFFDTTQYYVPANWEEEFMEEEEDDEIEEDLEKEDNQAGIMLKVPDEISYDLGISGFEKPENLHVTVLYFQEYPENLLEHTRAALNRLNFSGFAARISGSARFPSENEDAIVMLLDCPELHTFRDRLKEELVSKGIDITETFPEYRPHITLAYVSHGEDAPFKLGQPIDIELRDLELWHGDDRIDLISDSQWDVKEIGDALKVDWNSVDLDEFDMGLEEELEHKDITGGDPILTGRIVLAHLQEEPNYYTKLKELNKQAQFGRPPREGLVPQSGDPYHPDRWIRPQEADASKEPKEQLEELPLERKKLWLSESNSRVHLYGSVTHFPKDKLVRKKFEATLVNVAQKLPVQHIKLVNTLKTAPGIPMIPGGAIQKGIGGITYLNNITLKEGQGPATLIHEIGHVVSFLALSEEDSERIEDVYNKSMTDKAGFPTDYSTQNAEEFFAECYQFYFRQPKQMEKRNKEMYDLLRELFEVSEETTEPQENE